MDTTDATGGRMGFFTGAILGTVCFRAMFSATVVHPQPWNTGPARSLQPRHFRPIQADDANAPVIAVVLSAISGVGGKVNCRDDCQCDGGELSERPLE